MSGTQAIQAGCASLIALGRKPTVPEAAPLVAAYYAKRGNGAGGSLHIVLDDGNIDNESVKCCEKWATDAGDDDGVAIARLLLLMSKTQRRKLGHVSYAKEAGRARACAVIDSAPAPPRGLSGLIGQPLADGSGRVVEQGDRVPVLVVKNEHPALNGVWIAQDGEWERVS